MWKNFVITSSDENILCRNFLKVLYFTRRISWPNLIVRSRLTCRQKDVDSSKWRTKEREVVGHLPHFWNFCRVKFSIKKILSFLRLTKIFQQERKANYGIYTHSSYAGTAIIIIKQTNVTTTNLADMAE